MPKINRTAKEQALFELRVAIENQANLKEVPPAKLALVAGISERTLRSRRHDPGQWTFEQLLAISQRLGGLGITL